MDDIRELERQWYRYKAKKVMVVVAGFTLVGFLLGGLYYAYTQSQSNVDLLTKKKAEMKAKEPSKVIEPVLVGENTIGNTVSPKKVENRVSSDKYEVSLEPVIPIVDIEKEERKPVQRQTRTRVTQERVIRAKPSTYLTASELATLNTPLDTTNPKKINLNGTSKNYIETMKEKFSKTKNPREALLLAKAFYADGKYKEAEHWALVTNKLNTNLEESWFIFAKAKAKLGHKDEAIKILSSYYEKSHSEKAKVLIDEIKKGNL